MEAANVQRRIPFWLVWTCVTAFLALCLAYAMEERKLAEVSRGNGLVDSLFTFPHVSARLIGHGNDTIVSLDIGTSPSTGNTRFDIQIVRVSLDGKMATDSFPVLISLESYQSENPRFRFAGVKPNRSQSHRVLAELRWTTAGGEGSFVIDRSSGYW